MKQYSPVFVFMLSILVVSPEVTAVVRRVPSEFPTIQAAMNDINPGDTILIADGIYTGEGNELIWFEDVSLKMESENGCESCIIDCGGTGMGLYLYDSPPTRIEGITIRNSTESGLFAGGCFLTVSLCRFESNAEGGIRTNESIVVIEDCAFYNNTTRNFGAGLYLADSDAVVRNCRFVGNFAHSGGGAIACCFSGSYVIGGEEESRNYFVNNGSSFGADLCARDLNGTADARYNTFSGFFPSDYYVSPAASFDLTGCISEMTPLEQDVYVSPDGNDLNTGTSPGAPFRTIRHALSVIYGTDGNPLTVHLAPGIYAPSITGDSFPLPMMAYVMLAGDSEYTTILDAENQSTLLNCSFDRGSGVSGVTLTGAMSYNFYGAMGITGASPVVSNCIFQDNAGGAGGGISCYGSIPSAPQISNCIFTGNSADCWGGGIICSGWMAPQIRNCTFYQNSASSGGGAVHTIGGENPSPVLENCIVWDNAPVQFSFSGSGSPQVTYCDVTGGFPGVGNFNSDPLFVSSFWTDFCLSHIDAGQSETSSCFDTGSAASDLICYPVQDEMICMGTLSVRTDEVPDDGFVDVGYHVSIRCTHSGDINEDGRLTAADAQYAFCISLGMPTGLAARQLCKADCNGDGDTTAGDALDIFTGALSGISLCMDPVQTDNDIKITNFCRM